CLPGAEIWATPMAALGNRWGAWRAMGLVRVDPKPRRNLL
ncbi:MAG: hypothetical protein RLZZ499_1556, partial [Cyanobacteriota bacterium]